MSLGWMCLTLLFGHHHNMNSSKGPPLAPLLLLLPLLPPPFPSLITTITEGAVVGWEMTIYKIRMIFLFWKETLTLFCPSF